jgi:hypothetical protein
MGLDTYAVVMCDNNGKFQIAPHEDFAHISGRLVKGVFSGNGSGNGASLKNFETGGHGGSASRSLNLYREVMSIN